MSAIYWVLLVGVLCMIISMWIYIVCESKDGFGASLFFMFLGVALLGFSLAGFIIKSEEDILKQEKSKAKIEGMQYVLTHPNPYDVKFNKTYRDEKLIKVDTLYVLKKK